MAQARRKHKQKAGRHSLLTAERKSFLLVLDNCVLIVALSSKLT